MKRAPAWACANFDRHGADQPCRVCLNNFQRQKGRVGSRDMPPRVIFGRGWVGFGAAHWFDATDNALFPSKDGRRLLAQAVCGSICEVTLAWAPTPGSECSKCIRALTKAGRLAPYQ